jgi:lipopolysaccharide transport system ATP-binding protein
MSSDEIAVAAHGLGKCYQIYEKPQDRLWQFLLGSRRKLYREFWALRGIDLEVRRGETFGIVGRNGAGKTTLLQLIARTLDPTEGMVHANGRVTALLELGSGFHREFTGRENVFLAGSVLGIPRAEMEQRFDRIAAFADIGEFIDRPVKIYSRGMYARLAFAVYANLDADVFIVDEALAVGDARFRHRCVNRFRQLQDEGVAILYVSHDAQSMRHQCDRVAWIDGGELRMIGEPSKVVEPYLNAMFHGLTARPKPIPRAASGSAAYDARGVTCDLPSLPAADEVLGDHSFSFIGGELVDVDGKPLVHLDTPGTVRVRLAIQRGDGVEIDPMLRCGYILSDDKGLPVSGFHTGDAGIDFPAPKPGQTVRIDLEIALPALRPGSYALTVAITKVGAESEGELADQRANVFVFKATSARVVHGIVGADCKAMISHV